MNHFGDICASMKIAARILTSISLAVIGVLVALLLAEGYFRLFTPDDIAYFLEWRSKARQITRVREEERGTGLYRPNASVTIWGITYAINSDGFRDDDRYSRKKPPDTFRIMAVGDSYTFGAGVELEDTYSKKLEKLLNERHPSPLYRYYEVINAGIPGANTAMEVDFLREWGLKYNPDLVLVAFVLNDLEAPYGSKRPLLPMNRSRPPTSRPVYLSWICCRAISPTALTPSQSSPSTLIPTRRVTRSPPRLCMMH
jgi:hypothetical protein